MTTTVKTCFKCNTEKPISDFYKHPKMADGYLGKCKDCTKRDTRINRRKKSDYYRDYDRKRGNRQHKEYESKYRSRFPEKHAAHIIVNNAIRNKKLVKEPCFMCGCNNVHAHHVDYDKPLEVIWLCPTCHKRIHAYEDMAERIRSGKK